MREGARGCVASRKATRGGGGSQAGRRWPGRVAARAGRVPVLLAEEEGDRGGGGGLGRPDGAGPGKWRQVSGPGGLLSLSLFLFTVFYLCSVLFNWH